MYFINFISVYYRDHAKIHSKQRILPKDVNIFQLENNLIKEIIIQFLVGVGASVQIFILGSCTIKRYRFLATPSLTLFKISLESYFILPMSTESKKS